MAFRSRVANREYAGRVTCFRGRGLKTVSDRLLRRRGPRQKPVKVVRPEDRRHPVSFRKRSSRDVLGSVRGMDQEDSSLALDDFDVDLDRVQQEGLRITVENKDADFCVADPMFYEEIQRHMIDTRSYNEQNTLKNEIHYEDISDSADSDQMSLKKTVPVSHGPQHRLLDSGSTPGRRESSKQASHHYSRSPSPSHRHKGIQDKNYRAKQRRRSRSRSHGRTDSRDYKTSDRHRRKRQRSDSHERSASKSHRTSRSMNHRRSRSQSQSHRHSRSCERPANVRESCRSPTPDRMTCSRESTPEHRSSSLKRSVQDSSNLSFNDKSDSMPPWIKDPSKAMSVEEIEKYLESKLKQAELQSRSFSVGISESVKQDNQLHQSESFMEPLWLRGSDVSSTSHPSDIVPAVKEMVPFDLHDSLPEQPKLASPPKTLTAKPIKSILKNKTTEPLKQEVNAVGEIAASPALPSLSVNTSTKSEVIIPGLASVVDTEDEDKFLYGNTEPVKALDEQHLEKSSSEVSQYEPAFTGGYSKTDRKWDVAPTKTWPESIIHEETPPVETKKDDDVKIDPTIQNILKSIGFNFELSKLMQQKAQSQKKAEDGLQSFGGYVLNAESSSASGSTQKAPSKKGKYSRKPSLDIKESYEERARRYREEQLKLYQCSGMESAIEITDGSSSQSQGSLYSDTQPSSPKPQSVRYDHSLYNRSVSREHNFTGSESLHRTDLSGLEQLQNDYSLQEGSRLLRNNVDGHDKSLLCHSKMSSPSVKGDPYCHEGNSKSRKLDDRNFKRRNHSERTLWCGGDDDITVRQHDEWGRKAIPKENKSASKDLKQKGSHSESCYSSPETSGDSTKNLLAMNSEDKEDLMIELEKWQNRLNMLERELIRLRQEEDEIMRRQQRQKRCDCNSLLKDNVGLQEDIKFQMMLLSRAAEINTKLLLSGRSGDQTNDVDYLSQIKEKVETREDRFLKKVSLPVDKLSNDSHSSAVEKTDTARHPEHKSNSAESAEKESGVPEKGRKKWKVTQYEYFDPGDHWCRQCNLIFGKCEALFQHLHSAKHIDKHEQPWLPEALKNSQKCTTKGKGIAVPLKGVEFMVPAQAFYCILCKEFSGDLMCAEDHLKCHSHNTKYQSFIDDNQFYEIRYNQEKAASCPVLADTLQDKDSGATKDNSHERKRDVKQESMNLSLGWKQKQHGVEMYKMNNNEKGEKKTEENVSKKGASATSKAGLKCSSVNFKWKGKMPMIGKCPAYRKTATSTAVESDSKILFRLKNRTSALTKPGSVASQHSGVHLMKEGQGILKKDNVIQEEKHLVSPSSVVVSNSCKGNMNTSVKLEDIVLPDMPPPDSSSDPEIKSAVDRSSTGHKPESTAHQNINDEVGREHDKGVLDNTREAVIEKVEDIALPPLPPPPLLPPPDTQLLDHCSSPKAKPGSEYKKTVSDSEIIKGELTENTVKEENASENITRPTSLQELSSTSTCSDLRMEDSLDTKCKNVE